MSKFAGLGQASFGGVAPKLAQLTDTVLFGDVWESNGLSRRDRSLITVDALIAIYRHEQLPFHLQTAIEHDVSMEERRKSSPILPFMPAGRRLRARHP